MTILPCMLKPIASAADADSFTRAMVAAGKDYHYDDSPETIVDAATGARVFSDAECEALTARMGEIYGLPGYDPFSLLVFLTNSPPEHLALDAEMLRLYGEGLTAEQRECLHDEERAEEASGMLDDMQARLGLAPDIVDAARGVKPSTWAHRN